MPLEQMLRSGVPAVPVVRWGDEILHRPSRPAHHDPQMAVDHEGCLSYPGAFHPLARPDYAVCRGQDQLGEPIIVRGTGTLARCLQHETEHLRGIVFRDHLDEAGRRALRTSHTKVGNEFPPDWPS